MVELLQRIFADAQFVWGKPCAMEVPFLNKKQHSTSREWFWGLLTFRRVNEGLQLILCCIEEAEKRR